VKRDEALGLLWHTPRRPPYSKSHEGLFKADTFSWQCYPVIAQGLRRDKKALLVKITVDGPGYWDMRPVVVVNIDGEVQQIPIAEDGLRPYTTLGQNRGVEITLVQQDDFLGRIAKAQVVWLTLLEPSGDGHRSVKLSDKQVAVVREILDY